MGDYLELKKRGTWEYVSRKNCEGVVIILVYNESTDRYLVVEQYRPPVDERMVEFPAGLIDPGETRFSAAIRELREEAGVECTPDDLIDLGSVYSSVGLTDEKAYFFAVIVDDACTILAPILQGAEVDHGLESRWATEDELLQSKAGKLLSILARFKAKRSRPTLTFTTD